MRNSYIGLLGNTGFKLEQSKAPEKTSILNKIVNKVIPITNASDDRLDNLKLSECRLTQDEDSHIKKENGSVYALDIACVRGKSFTVYSPTIKNIYIIEHIGYDSRLGDYVILRHSDLRFVYGHTQTKLKVGTALKNRQELGVINKSGMSENYHLHIELWKGNENISWKYVQGKGLYTNDKSFALRDQRGLVSDAEVNTKVFEFISKYEGLRLQAYDDGKQWSVGYGSKSYKGEVITKEEAVKRLRLSIQNIRTKYELSGHPINVQIGLTSFIYNLGSLSQKQIWLLDNEYYTALANDIQLYVKADGEVLLGLVNRRADEGELIKT